MTPSARVVLLAGPSGSGKSTLAAQAGVPVLRLDDFYREGDDPLLPRDATGQVDWDLPAAWHAEDAVDAIIRLASTGKIHAPHYELGADRRVGGYDLVLDGSPVFVAEGLFADRIVEGCREAGVLADAVVLAPGGGRTFARRLVRDVAESRKPTHVLVRRGLRLWREHSAVVRRCELAGMRRRTSAEVLGLLEELSRPVKA
ncbi:uridine kinase family protein [Actinokineospora alba]|uniref:uridine kinase family protein n=1 Tax=Actinokineospora alba TaxID=504798 RepID=UPI00105FB121|nr:uridine kinase [Actinokineospora alba]TDP70588.1 uridine kinase [Actinokineospora alba]